MEAILCRMEGWKPFYVGWGGVEAIFCVDGGGGSHFLRGWCGGSYSLLDGVGWTPFSVVMEGWKPFYIGWGGVETILCGDGGVEAILCGDGAVFGEDGSIFRVVIKQAFVRINVYTSLVL